VPGERLRVDAAGDRVGVERHRALAGTDQDFAALSIHA
jgi:hypothetical protein